VAPPEVRLPGEALVADVVQQLGRRGTHVLLVARRNVAGDMVRKAFLC